MTTEQLDYDRLDHRPPDWALRLAEEPLRMFHGNYGYRWPDLEKAIARAIADAVDAARVEAAGVSTNWSRGVILALRGKEPKP